MKGKRIIVKNSLNEEFILGGVLERFYWCRIGINNEITYEENEPYGSPPILQNYMKPFFYNENTRHGRTAISYTPAGAIALVDEYFKFRDEEKR